MKKINLAIVGATGNVGRTILEVMENKDIEIGDLYLFSSKKSAGSKIEFRGEEYTVEELTEEVFDRDIDIATFSAGGGISEKFAPIAREKGIVVVDNSSHFRMDEGIPLVVPEVNPEAIKEEDMLISNPNCSTIQSVLPLKPLYDKYGIKRIIYSTYQAVSGSGLAAIEELENKTCDFYPHPIAYNCLPHIDDFLDNGYTKEEMKMIDETKKILKDQDIAVTATTVRVPIKNGHAVSINVELEKEFDIDEVRKDFENFPGIIVEDDVKNNIYPLEQNADGRDEIFVGRIRRDFSVENGLNFWCVADNLRKGAATNTVQIVEYIVNNR